LTAREDLRLEEWFDGFAPGAARAVFTDDVRGVVAALAISPGRRGVAAIHLSPALQGLDTAMEQSVRALAEAARELWPDWYGEAAESPDGPSPERVASRRPQVLPRWLEAARESARRGQAPVVFGAALEVQARQLALALDAEDLLVVLALERAAPGDAALPSFARAAEWLASKTEARVVAVLPKEIEGSLSVDPIAYEALRLVAQEPFVAQPPLAHVFPVVGRPHPGSEAEQVLARALARDPELSTLFEFNQRLSTVRRSHPTVDLVWREGRIVVEVDGWEMHGTRWAFASDRRRDYELALSGYTVLRLTNDEVLTDSALAVDKIRDLVRARRTPGKEGR
jgi:very-short-patch-repair endonuclease